MVTELGLGAMDTPTAREGPQTLERALDLGIDFVDTAREYAGSEFMIGQAVRERAEAGRPAFHIASKTFSHSINGSQRDVDRSLSILGVERISLYQLHDISSLEAWQEATGEDGALEGLQIAQYRGLIEHIGISSHSLEVLRLAIESGEFATVMLEYSAFFTETAAADRAGARAGRGRDRDAPARRLGPHERDARSHRRGLRGPAHAGQPAALRLLAARVSVAIPGARFPSRIEENVATATAYEPMDAAEQRALEAEAQRLY